MAALQVTDATFKKEVEEASGVVLVDFWAAWCGPCRMIGPVIDELVEEYQGKAKICKMNVDENRDVPGRFGVMSIPTLIIFKNGEKVDTIVGAQPKSKIKEKLDLVIGG